MPRQDLYKRIGISVLATLCTYPVTYVLKKAFEAWGILDPVAAVLGRWLKLHFPVATAGWTAAAIISLCLYGLLLWKIWLPRHVHHLPAIAEAKPQATVAARILKAPHTETTEVFRYSDHALRDFDEDISLPSSVTAAAILAECEGKTELQCESVTAIYLGQRLKVSGELYAATSFLGAGTTVSIALDGVDRGTAFLTFEYDRARISVLKPGSHISATGRIVAVTASELKLMDCRLL